jgi:hypothetical protein
MSRTLGLRPARPLFLAERRSGAEGDDQVGDREGQDDQGQCYLLPAVPVGRR